MQAFVTRHTLIPTPPFHSKEFKNESHRHLIHASNLKNVFINSSLEHLGK